MQRERDACSLCDTGMLHVVNLQLEDALRAHRRTFNHCRSNSQSIEEKRGLFASSGRGEAAAQH